jgi:lipoyl(octanoyl) transferase
MRRQWRLIYDSPLIGRENMAVDAAILTAVGAGDAPPTLRLYSWSPPCLSLGYGQKTTDVDFERLTALNWDVVRRPTGGRAILHTDELTYSVSLPADEPIASGRIVESYRRLSAALLAALEALGANATAERREERSAASGAVCFDVPSHYEITVKGKKLVGSAQLRRKGSVLQHGSLPLRGDIARICGALRYEDDRAREAAKAKVRARATTLEAVLGSHVVSWQEAADAVAAGFSATFEIEFTQGELTSAERQNAALLAGKVYANVEKP